MAGTDCGHFLHIAESGGQTGSPQLNGDADVAWLETSRHIIGFHLFSSSAGNTRLLVNNQRVAKSSP
jgi:hypothetical protein